MKTTLLNDKMSAGYSLLTVLLCVLFGANSVAIKISLTGIGVFTAAGLRFTMAGIAIFLWTRMTGQNLSVNKHQAKQLLIVSIGFTVQLSCFYAGINKTTASHGVLIANLLPFIVLILAHFFIPGDSITIKKFIGIMLGFAGVLFLLYDNSSMGNNFRTGDIIVLFAVILWGCNAIYVKKIISEFHAIQITLYPMLFGAPLFLLAGFFWDGTMVKFMNISTTGAIFYQAFITAGFGFVAWNSLLKKFGATILHTFIFIMPVSGVLFSVLLLGETLSINLFVSIVFIATGVIIVNW